jgi:hypothetical protein
MPAFGRGTQLGVARIGNVIIDVRGARRLCTGRVGRGPLSLNDLNDKVASNFASDKADSQGEAEIEG